MSIERTDVLEPFIRESGFEYWNRYAAVNDEFIPIHMYDEAGQAAGYPTAFGMGNLTWSYLHLAIHSWFGDAAVIARVDAQFRNAVIRRQRTRRARESDTKCRSRSRTRTAI